MDTSLLLLKKVEMRRLRVTSLRQNPRKKRNIILLSLEARNEDVVTIQVLTATHKNNIAPEASQDKDKAASCMPIIFMTSRSFASFSSTTSLVSLLIGYKVAMTNPNPSK